MLYFPTHLTRNGAEFVVLPIFLQEVMRLFLTQVMQRWQVPLTVCSYCEAVCRSSHLLMC